MYFDLCNELNKIVGMRLDEALSASDLKTMRDQIAEPEICPMDFDVTFPGWLARIELWGKIAYYHKDTEKSRWKKKVSKKQFIDRISDESLNKQFGKWQIKKNKLTKCTLRRDYIGVDGRHYVEEFIVDIRLRKELR